MPKTLKEVQKKYYSLLKKQGFKDIEDESFPDRPLKDWHNKKFSSDKAMQKMAIRKEYQKLIDDFTNSKDFGEICVLMTKHGNCRFVPQDIKDIWELSTQKGMTERSIAKQFKRSKLCIHSILERLREWMKIT